MKVIVARILVNDEDEQAMVDELVEFVEADPFSVSTVIDARRDACPADLDELGYLVPASAERWRVTELQAVEPEALKGEPGIEVVVAPEKDSMGFARVDVLGPSREAVVEYVRREWGDGGDPAWFAEYVEGRVEVAS